MAQLLSGALTIYDAIKVVSILAGKIITTAVESKHNGWRGVQVASKLSHRWIMN